MWELAWLGLAGSRMRFVEWTVDGVAVLVVGVYLGKEGIERLERLC